MNMTWLYCENNGRNMRIFHFAELYRIGCFGMANFSSFWNLGRAQIFNLPCAANYDSRKFIVLSILAWITKSSYFELVILQNRYETNWISIKELCLHKVLGCDNLVGERHLYNVAAIGKGLSYVTWESWPDSAKTLRHTRELPNKNTYICLLGTRIDIEMFEHHTSGISMNMQEPHMYIYRSGQCIALLHVMAWTSCQMRKVIGCACAGNVGDVFPPPRVSNPDMHHSTCIGACQDRQLAVSFIVDGGGNHTRHSRRMLNPQFYVSGKRPIVDRFPLTLFKNNWSYAMNLSCGDIVLLNMMSHVPVHVLRVAKPLYLGISVGHLWYLSRFGAAMCG